MHIQPPDGNAHLQQRLPIPDVDAEGLCCKILREVHVALKGSLLRRLSRGQGLKCGVHHVLDADA